MSTPHPQRVRQRRRLLQQRLGLFDATMLVVGSMIGSGIFIVSADIARTVGCAGLAARRLAGHRRASR